MLRIAVQSKGRLYDETMMLLEEAGIKLNRGKRILLLSAKGFPVEVLFLRDDDIPQSVANGVADIGIVGDYDSPPGAGAAVLRGNTYLPELFQILVKEQLIPVSQYDLLLSFQLSGQF